MPGVVIAARRAAGLTQEELAERAGISTRSVSNIERGLVDKPQRHTAERLAAALGLRGDTAARFVAAARGQGEPADDATMPHQLPPDLPDFTGRAAEIARVLEWLSRRVDAVPVVVVTGVGGSGKSAVLTRAAHRASAQFPDGQLYAQLRGGRTDVTDVLSGFLQGLGVSASVIPGPPAARAALFRSVTAGRRLLIVLEDPQSAGDVRELMPNAVGCAVLVSSRRALPTLAGAEHLELGAFTEDEARGLLTRMIGTDQPAAPIAQILKSCGGLPLALRIAAGRLIARPGWTSEDLANRLTTAPRLLDEFEVGELRIRGCFEVSYRVLDDRSAAAFRMLGALDHTEQGVMRLAAVLGKPVADAERVLERLVDARLLDSPGHRRYRLHDLLREFAAELLALQDPALAATARRRAVDGAIATTFAAATALRPHTAARTRIGEIDTSYAESIDSYLAAMHWYQAEWPALRSLADQITDRHEAARLLLLMAEYPFQRSDWPALHELAESAHDAAAGDDLLRAQAAELVGNALVGESRYSESADYHAAALTLFERLGDHERIANLYNNIGCRLWLQGQIDAAESALQRSIEMAVRAGWNDIEGAAVGNHGNICEHRDDLGEAAACQARSAALMEAAQHRPGVVRAYDNLGRILGKMGRHDEARTEIQRALSLVEQVDNNDLRLEILLDLAIVNRLNDRPGAALEICVDVAEQRRATRHRRGEAEALTELGKIYQALADHAAARRTWHEALQIITDIKADGTDEIHELLRTVS